MEHPISDLLNVSMKSLKEMIDANTIIGTPINYSGAIIIPVSRVHLGFLSGGSDIKPNKDKENPLFGGGTGGGLSVVPIAFLVIQNSEVKLLALNDQTHLIEKAMDTLPKIVDKAKVLFKENTPIDKI